MSQQAERSYSVGDRVRVYPASRKALGYLDGELGTIEKILPDDGSVLGGALYVRLDCDGEVLGIGPERVKRADGSSSI